VRVEIAKEEAADVEVDALTLTSLLNKEKREKSREKRQKKSELRRKQHGQRRWLEELSCRN
jgi:hypothetical protein